MYFAVRFLLLPALCVTVVWGTLLKIEITKHHPCRRNIGPRRTVLRFPSSRDSQERLEKLGNNCFKVTGRNVKVYRPGILPEKDYQILNDLYIGNKLQSCANQESNGCEGMGSCTYCDLCGVYDKVNQKRRLVQIFKGNKPVQCEGQVRPGRYNNLSFKFCMPTKRDILSLLDSDYDRANRLWNSFIRNTFDGRKSGVSMRMNIRLYDRKVNHLAMNPKKRRNLTHGRNGREGMVACHTLYIQVSEATRRS